MRKFFVVAMLTAWLPSFGWSTELSNPNRQAIAEAASQARDQCFKEMYRDTNAYAFCIRELRTKYKRDPYRLLGTEYFGFVGALSYMRISQAAAQSIASEFLPHFKSTQKQLKISDEDLCSVVPGNCVERIAQTGKLERERPASKKMRVRCEVGICRLEPV